MVPLWASFHSEHCEAGDHENKIHEGELLEMGDIVLSDMEVVRKSLTRGYGLLSFVGRRGNSCPEWCDQSYEIEVIRL